MLKGNPLTPSWEHPAGSITQLVFQLHRVQLENIMGMWESWHTMQT